MAPQNLLDRISNVTGKATSWLTLAMVILTSIIVIMRYVFDAGFIWMQEQVANEDAAAVARSAGIDVVQDRCIYKDWLRLMNT